MDLIGLRLERLILHEVPASSAKEPGAPVRLSDGVVALTGRNRRYVRERLIKDLAKDAREVIEDPGIESPVPPEIRGYFAGSRTVDAFVHVSQALALHLREVQTGVNSPGMVLVADCLMDGSPAVLVAKVELERGVQATPVTVDGRLTYDMTLLDDLVFGQTSRIFKVGLFTGLAQDGSRLIGHAIDRQAGGPDVAGFFLSKYLGCEYTQRPEVLTRSFAQAAEAWFNSKVPDPERRTKYEVALLAELGSQRREIDANEFADRNLDLVDRDDFKRDVVAKQASAKFPKDTVLVAIRKVKIEMRDGIMILVDPDQVESHIEVEPESLTVRDKVAKVSGNGRERRRLTGDGS